MSDAPDAVVARAAEFVSGPAEAEETPSDPEAPVAEETQPETEEEPEFTLDPEIPEDLQQLFEEPDFEAEAEAQVQDEEQEFEYEDDPEKAELKKNLIKAQKEAEHYKKLRVTQDKAKWEAEAKKYAPLSEPFLGKIDADSRRSYLRQAKEYHDAIAPLVKSKIIDPMAKALEEARSGELQAARQEAEHAWGKPTVDATGAVPADASARQAKYEAAAKKGDLVSMIKARAFGEVNE